jgi:hypothetical protein
MISEETMREAIDRIGRTPDGELLYLYLQRRLMEVDRSGRVRALRLENGQRIFASELMSLLSLGLEESVRLRRSDAIVIEHARKHAVAGPDSRRRGIAAAIASGRQPSEFDTDDTRGPYGFGQT